MSAPIVHGGGLTEAAQHYGGQLHEWLDLSTGINPNPVSLPDIPLDVWHRLPDRHRFDAARVAAQNYYNSGPVLPLPVPGTQSVIQLLPCLVAHTKPVAILSPTYGEYTRVFQEAGYRVDPVQALEHIDDRYGAVMIVNPNNPDGRSYSQQDLLVVHQRIKGGLLLIDEAFGDAEPEYSLVPLVTKLSNLVIFRSFGKFFGLAGLRLGFVIAHSETLMQFENWLGPWAVSGPALFLAAQLMQNDTAAIITQINERKEALSLVLSGAGLKIVGGTPLFTLVSDQHAASWHHHLCQQRILVRKFDYTPHWLRFGLTANAQQDERLAQALTVMDDRA